MRRACLRFSPALLTYLSCAANPRCLFPLVASNLPADPPSILLYVSLRFSTTLRYSTLLYATLRYSTLLYSTLLYATLRYSTLLYATQRYSTNSVSDYIALQLPRQLCNCRPFANSLGNSTMHNCQVPRLPRVPNIIPELQSMGLG
jgi:hypothetical protein